MGDLPPITVVLLTYGGSPERVSYAESSLKSISSMLRYSGPLHLHIADDGSPNGHVEMLREIASNAHRVIRGEPVHPWDEVSWTNSERRGYGANWNAATGRVHGRGGLVLPLEDDWELTRELDLDPLARALMTPLDLPTDELVRHGIASLGCIRLGYLGFWAPIRGTFVHHVGQTFVLLDRDSPSQDIFAGHPRLETVEWERWVGLWPEGRSAQETELAVCGRPAARTGVAWPVDLVQTWGSLFGHIGTVPAANPGEEAHG